MIITIIIMIITMIIVILKNDIQRGNLLFYNMEGKKAQELSTVTNTLEVFTVGEINSAMPTSGAQFITNLSVLTLFEATY